MFSNPKTQRLSRFFRSFRAGLWPALLTFLYLVPVSECVGQTDETRNTTAKAPESKTQDAKAATSVDEEWIKFDPEQKEPVLMISRQQLMGRRLEYVPVFEMFADGKLVNRRGSRTEKTIQLTPDEVKSVLRQAVIKAKFFSLDPAKLQKQFKEAAVGKKSFPVKDQELTKIDVKVNRGQKVIAIRGYSLARLKLTELRQFQDLAAAEGMLEYAVAQRVVGDRSDDILSTINAEIKRRKIGIGEVKAKDLQAAYARKGGRFQARYLKLKTPKQPVADSQKAADNSEPTAIRILYFIQSEGAAPTVRFFGDIGQ